MSTEYGDEARAEIACDRAGDAGYLHLDDVLLPADFTAEQLDSALETVGKVEIANWLAKHDLVATPAVRLERLERIADVLEALHTIRELAPKPTAEPAEADPAADQHK